MRWGARCGRSSTPTDTRNPADLRAALEGVRGLLLDLDGVLSMRGAALPGSSAALADLERHGIPYRVMTNTSAMSRAALAGYGRAIGVNVPPEHIVSALSVTASWTRCTFPDQPLLVMATDEALSEFAGQRVLSHDEILAGAAAAADSLAAVVAALL